MKILYIANIRLPTEKAHGIQIMKMCEAFARLGHEVELIVPNRHTPITGDPFLYYGVDHNFTITRLPTFDTVSWGRMGFWLQTFSFIYHAVRYARRTPADMLYSRDPALFFFGGTLPGKKLAWEVHTRPAKRVIEKIKKLPVSIVAITGGLRDVLIEMGIPHERVIVAHDAVDANMFAQIPDRKTVRGELSLPQDKKLIAYIGKYKTMGESKGVEGIISAVGIVHTKFPDAALLIVGLNQDEFTEVKALTKVAGLDDAYLVGHVGRDDVARYMRAADVLVMNYPNTEHYARFMSPLKLFEYMASGTPIVTSNLPSVTEILNKDNALLIEADNSRDLSGGILSLLENQVFSYSLAERAFRDVSANTWDLRAKKILHFLGTRSL